MDVENGDKRPISSARYISTRRKIEPTCTVVHHVAGDAPDLAAVLEYGVVDLVSVDGETRGRCGGG